MAIERGNSAALTMFSAILLLMVPPPVFAAQPLSLNSAMEQDDAWFGGFQAAQLGDNIISHQFPRGGWAKNIDPGRLPATSPMREVPDGPDDFDLKPDENPATRPAIERPTVDNNATTLELRVLARICKVTKNQKYIASFDRGIDFVLGAQYPNGGWPQADPPFPAYASRITFNDNAMTLIMALLKDTADKSDYDFVDAPRRSKAKLAFDRGVDCVLKCQVRVNGHLTGWCQQYDEHDLTPAWARRFEPPALAASESVSICRVLMSIDRPSAEVTTAVDAAVSWLDSIKLNGIRMRQVRAPGTLRGFDRVVVTDPSAPPLWSRYIEIGTNKPIFCGRDGVIRYNLADVEIERRSGYQWYTTLPASLIAEDYPAWRRRLQRDPTTRQ